MPRVFAITDVAEVKCACVGSEVDNHTRTAHY